jgi:PAS domain S-box-containing protein
LSDEPDEPSPTDAPQDWRRRCEAAERELRLLRTLLDLQPDFFYVHDHDMRYRYANRAAADYFGLPKEQLVGKLLAEVEADPQQAAFYVEVCKGIMAGGVPRLTTDLPLRLRDGSLRYVRQYDVPHRDPETGRPMLFGLSRDITAERQLVDERVRRERAEGELEVARVVQRSILPRVPLDAGAFEVAGASVPSHYAAGDFYDWWTTPEGESLVCLGDVSGHGIGPAILAAACKAYARTLLRGRGELRAAMRRLNAAVAGELSDGRFITFVAVELDAERHALSVLSAGHGPVLVYTAGDGAIAELPSHGLPLGIDAGEPFDPPVAISMAPGDALLVLSDGIPEARDKGGREFGMANVLDVVRSNAGADAATLAGALTDAAVRFGGAQSAADDVTAVIIRLRE